MNDVVLPCLRSISNNDHNTLLSLHTPMVKHDNISDENNRKESIQFERSVSIGP